MHAQNVALVRARVCTYIAYAPLYTKSLTGSAVMLVAGFSAVLMPLTVVAHALGTSELTNLPATPLGPAPPPLSAMLPARRGVGWGVGAAWGVSLAAADSVLQAWACEEPKQRQQQQRQQQRAAARAGLAGGALLPLRCGSLVERACKPLSGTA